MTIDDGTRWLAPSPRLGRLRIAEVAAAGFVPLAVAVSVSLAVGSPVAAAVTAIAVLLTCVAVGAFLLRRVRSWSYAERADDLLVRRGVLVRRLSVIPYGRMQFVDVVAGPLERIAGLATVHMHTAAAASDARIPGLLVADANRLRDQLAALGEGQAAGL